MNFLCFLEKKKKEYKSYQFVETQLLEECKNTTFFCRGTELFNRLRKRVLHKRKIFIEKNCFRPFVYKAQKMEVNSSSYTLKSQSN